MLASDCCRFRTFARVRSDVDQKISGLPGIAFFFSNGVLSFTPVVPRIRLRFQTLTFGFSALYLSLRAGPTPVFLTAASVEAPLNNQ
jgi:hypothetical protein